MKFIYALVSSESDFYTEQCAISVYSLKKYNKDAKVTVICDNDTYHYIKHKGFLSNLIDELCPILINKSYTQLQKSRYLKTTVRNIIEGDFIFIDTDTIITGKLDEINTFIGEIGAVKVQDSDLWDKKNQHRHFKKYNTKRLLPVDFNYGIDHYYNSGVILCKDTVKTREFYKTWHLLWLEGSEKYHDPHDQCNFDRANAIHNNLVSELKGIYNMAGIYPIGSMRYLHECRIFHYFASSKKLDYLFIKDHACLMKIRNKGITPEIDWLIENIKEEYIKGIEINLEKDPFLVRVAKFLSNKYPKLNSFSEKSYKLIRR